MSLSYDEIKELKKGDKFWEGRHNMPFIVTITPYEIEAQINGEPKNQLLWWGFSEFDGDCEFMVTEGLEHYGASIYRGQAYYNLKDLQDD